MTWEREINDKNIGQRISKKGAFTELKASIDPVDEHGVGDRGFADERYLPKILVVVTASFTGDVAVSTMDGGVEKITGTYTRTLPAAVVGMHGLFRASTAAAFSLKAGASDHFELFDGTILDAGDKQTSGAGKNEFIQVYCEVANTWITISQNGAFTDTGA